MSEVKLLTKEEISWRDGYKMALDKVPDHIHRCHATIDALAKALLAAIKNCGRCSGEGYWKVDGHRVPCGRCLPTRSLLRRTGYLGEGR